MDALLPTVASRLAGLAFTAATSAMTAEEKQDAASRAAVAYAASLPVVTP
jgi:hypothetical protein